MTIERSLIEELLKQLNEAENRRPNVSTEQTIAGIDALMASDFEGWHNGIHIPNRDAERQTERLLFELITDYHRDIEQVIIDPPFVAFTWRIKGTANEKVLELHGCSIAEINTEGKVRRSWVYFDNAQFTSIFASDS